MMSNTLSQHTRQSALTAVLVLLLPLLGMLFTAEVNWGPGDFLLAGVLVFAAALVYRLAAMHVQISRMRWLLGAAVLLGLALVWAELAVGLFN